VYKHILIPTDGSRRSGDAIEHGMALAQAINAKVTALTVSMPFYSYAAGPGKVADTPDSYERCAKDLTARYLAVATQAAAALDVSCDALRVEHDHPYEAIINTAEELGCDAIVMASHGRRGISAIVLGSETVKVLTHSAIPVIVIRGQSPEAFFAAS
jgi:nucleotide-binding universal stress UspA family protein